MGETQDEQDSHVTLKVGPVKRANRITAKIGDYREEKGRDQWPFAQ